jgi:hypothetical protein
MKNIAEIHLKEEKEPTIWERFVYWLNGDASQLKRPVQQVPKTGTHTDILLSQSQKVELKQAVDSPLQERTSDTSLLRRADTGQDSQLII